MPIATFVDTSGFYSILVRADEQHRRAADWLAAAREHKTTAVTTDYVLDETATLLVARGLRSVLDEFFNRLMSSSVCRIEWIGPERFEKARDYLVKHKDKDYSFTDCVSFTVMSELHISEALTKDEHFSQAGYRALLLK